MCEDYGNDYKSMCANEETVEEKGLPRRRKLAYELECEGIRLPDLGWCPPTWVAPESRAWCVARLAASLDAGLGARRSPELAGSAASRRREGRGEEKEKKRRERLVRKREKRVFEIVSG